MTYKQQAYKVLSIAASVAASLALVAPLTKAQSTTIKIDGSSTVYPITEAVAEEFQNDNSDIQVTVGISGTGGGFKKFCSDDSSIRTHISNASRPIKDKEKALCEAAGVEYIEIPVAYDAIAVVVNKDNPVDDISTDDLKKIWSPEAEGTVNSWIQVTYRNLNKLTLFGPGADSGTFDYFTKKINGEEGASRTDYTPSEDDNVLVQGVSGTEGALGYFGLSYYLENQDKIKALAVNGVVPSMETVIDGTYSPLSRPIYIYVNKEAADIPEVSKFVEYYLTNAGELVPETGSVPLQDEDYKAGMDRFSNRVIGTAK